MNSGGSWIGYLIIAACTMENNVASDVHIQKFKSKEVAIMKSQDAFVFAQAVHSDKKVAHNVKLHATKESNTSTWSVYRQF